MTVEELMEVLQHCNKNKPVIVASTVGERLDYEEKLLKKAVFSHIDHIDCLSPNSVCNAAIIRISGVILKA